MNIAIEDIELIDRYNNGLLSPQEALDFTSRLQNDVSFQELYADISDVENLVQSIEVKKITDIAQQEYTKVSNAGNGLSSKIFSIVGGIVLVGFAAYFITKKDETPAPSNVEIATKSDDYQKDTNKLVTEQTINTTILQTQQKQQHAQHFSSNSSKKNTVIQKSEQEIKSEGNENVNQSVDKEQAYSNLQTGSANAVINCDTKIDIKYAAFPTCVNENTGSVKINSISGAEKPYKLFLNSQLVEGNNLLISNLSAGEYFLELQDVKNCKSEIYTLNISQVECAKISNSPKTASENYLVYLNEQEWKIPNCPSRGMLEITSQTGTVVAKLNISADNNSSWIFVNNQNAAITVGVYLFSILDTETNSQRVGTITIGE